MRALVTVSGGFEASHVVADHSTCGRGDGHAWTVEATLLESDIGPLSKMVVDHGEFRAALIAVLSEFDHRNLNDMLPGVVTTPEGIAAYVHERLILNWPWVTMVSVSAGPYRAVLEWPLR